MKNSAYLTRCPYSSFNKEDPLDSKIFSGKLCLALAVGSVLFCIGEPLHASEKRSWEQVAASWVYADERTLLQSAGCKSQAAKQKYSTDLNQAKAAQEKYFSEADLNVQHTMDLHGLRKDIFEKWKTRFLQDKSLYADIYKDITPEKYKATLEVEVYCFRVGSKMHPEMAPRLNEAIKKLEKDIQVLAAQQKIDELTPKVFVDVFFKWWGLKTDALKELDGLPGSPSVYRGGRYQFMHAYRQSLGELFQNYNTNSADLTRFGQEKKALNAYLKKNPEVSSHWLKIQETIKQSIPKLTTDTFQRSGTVVGVVFEDKTDQPVSYAAMKLWRKTEGEQLKETLIAEFYTDSTGRYVLPAMPPGNYSLSADKLVLERNIQYSGSFRRFFIRPQEVLMIDFPMEKQRVTLRPVAPQKK